MNNNTPNLKNLPPNPGCYLFFDKAGKILYIGKAKNLKNRARSYFNKKASLSPAKKQMVLEIAKIETISVRNESEAFLLEANLIKKHQPPYNIILKDDKFFQYIKITNEKIPRLTTARKIENDQAEYFGPYSSGLAVRQTLKLLKKIYSFRTEKQNDFVFDILRVDEKFNSREYSKILNQIKRILRGRTQEVEKNLSAKMKKASDEKKYETAAFYRDQINNLRKLTVPQQAIIPQLLDIDCLNWAEYKNKIFLALLKIRQGKLIDKLNADFKNTNEDPKEIIASFIKQYYLGLADQPKILLTPLKINLEQSDIDFIFKNKINIKTPIRGKFKKLLELTKINAENFAKKSEISFLAARDIDNALKNLANKIKIRSKLGRIECYDISNIQGKYAVGSMVVFTRGVPEKSQYRKFTIKYTAGKPNDYAMLSEILQRRFNHPEWQLPDLVIIDGGKGQLNIARKALAQKKINKPVISLAKKEEEIFLPDIKNPIKLKPKSPEFFLVQRIRDEAHRFAITFYRQKHQRIYSKK